MNNIESKDTNKDLLIKTISTSVIVIFCFYLVYIFLLAEPELEDGLYIDNDNTEIVTTEDDLKKIESRLDELDIDLEDILNELEL